MELNERTREYLKGRVKYLEKELNSALKNRKDSINLLKMRVKKVKEANEKVKEYKETLEGLYSIVGRSDWEV